MKLGQGAFGNCTGLSGTIEIPAGLATIDIWVFGGDNNISAFSVNPANPNFSSIDGVLFDKTTTRLIRCPPLKTGAYSIPSSVTWIDAFAFHSCSGLTGQLLLPSGLTSIEGGVFKDCTGFTGDLTLPPNLAQIRTAAFQGCSGFNGILTIPASTHTIRENGFKNCSGFTRAHFLGDAPSVSFDTFEGMNSDFTFLYNPGSTGFTTPEWYGYPCHPTPPILAGIGNKSIQAGHPIVFTVEAENNGPRLTYSASGSNPP